MYINNPGHMTKMAAMPIYGKKNFKNLLSKTGGPISTKLGMKHGWLKHYNVYINHDPVMTDFFLRQGQHKSPMHLNGENFKNVILGESLTGNGQ